MTVYATCECFLCHKRVPKNQARQVSYEVQTGRSGGSVKVYSTPKKHKQTYGYSSGRNYYANRTAWICDDCYPAYAKRQATASRFKAIAFIAVIAFGGYVFLSGPHSPSSDSTTAEKKDAVIGTQVQQPSNNAALNRSDQNEETAPSVETLQLSLSTGAKSVQNRLGELGYLNGSIDGVWGPLSQEALKSFKSKNRLPANDTWDTATQATLFSNSAISVDDTLSASAEANIRLALPGTTLDPNSRVDALRIQGQLNNRGYRSSTNGTWDEQTRNSLRLFKRDNGLRVDDLWNRATELKLFER